MTGEVPLSPERFQPPRHVPPTTRLNKLRYYLRLAADFQVLSVRRCLQNVLPSVKGEVLDVGCGEMPYRHLFQSPEIRYRGLDSVAAIDYHYDNPEVIKFDGQKIPIPDNSIDFIVCTEVLEHVQAPAPLLNEFHRVLKTGGRGFVTVPWSARWHYIPHDYYRYSPSALQTLFECFSDVRITARGTDGVVIASKILVLWLRCLTQPFAGEKRRFTFFTIPAFFAGIVFTPGVAMVLVLGHLCLWFTIGSSDDPLGYAVAFRKTEP